MEEDPRKSLRDRLVDHGMEYREHRETVEKYEQAGKIGRWLIRRRNPRAVDYYNYLQAQQSVRDAIISAQQNEGYLVVH